MSPSSKIRQFLQAFGLAIVSSAMLGCGGGKSSSPTYSYATGDIKFLDDVQSNTSLDAGIRDIVLLGVDGKERRVDELQGGQNLVLVVTRGNTEPICPYCSSQVAEYIKSYESIADEQATVVVVYPIEKLEDKDRREAFLQKTRSLLKDPSRPVPFPIFLDVELKAVDRLGIRRNLSKPATYILDREGRVRFAYVGAHLGDRPSVKAVVEQLRQIEAEGSG